MSTNTAPDSSDSDGNGVAFVFPPIHSFPPFYTLQPNPQSRAQQLAQWRKLILDYCRQHRIFTLSVASQDETHSALFGNSQIQRSLSGEAVRQVLADLVAHKQAQWQDVSPSASTTAAALGATKATIYWKTPQEWADTIYQWVTNTGQNKSIMTMFELQQGHLVETQGRLKGARERSIAMAY